MLKRSIDKDKKTGGTKIIFYAIKCRHQCQDTLKPKWEYTLQMIVSSGIYFLKTCQVPPLNIQSMGDTHLVTWVHKIFILDITSKVAFHGCESI